MSIDPNTLGEPTPLNGGFRRVTRGSSKPLYEPKPQKPGTPTELVPDVTIDTIFDRDNFLDCQPSPEIIQRVDQIQSRIERLSEKQKIRSYIGERIVNGGGYLSLNPDVIPKGINHRPHRFLEKVHGGLLDRINKRHLGVTRAAIGRVVVNPDVEGKKQTFRPFFNQYEKGPGERMKRGWGERRALGVAARKYRNNARMAKLYEKSFRYVLTRPSRTAKRLSRKRDRLVLKAEALHKK
jgi:hypothetical protein